MMDVRHNKGDGRGAPVSTQCARELNSAKDLAGMKFLGRAIVMIIDQGPGEQVDDRRIALMGVQTDMPATLCAIRLQPPEAGRPLIEKHKISFDLLTDHGNEYAAKLGLRFKLPGDLMEVCPSFGNDLVLAPAARGSAIARLHQPGHLCGIQ